MRYINCCVCMICLLIFMGIKFSWIILGFLSMITYEVLYTRCLRYYICSTCFLNSRISTYLQASSEHEDSYTVSMS